MADYKRPPGRPRKNAPPQTVETVIPVTRNNATIKENVEAGDNSRFLGHALKVADMPLVDLNDPEAVRQRIRDYFEMCFEADMKPSVSGLCSAVKINRTTLLDWKRGKYRADTHQAIILDAYKVLESLWEEYMQNGKINPVSGIFLGKNNYGYQDKQEMVLTPNTGMPEALDVKAIEAKYAELPEE